jgi:hypothetical protein
MRSSLVTVSAFVLIGAGCSTATTTATPPRVCHADELQPGLYKVVKRTCEQPHGHDQYCPLIDYVELRRGADFRVRAPLVFVEWFAERPSPASSADPADYAYEVEPLNGHCGDNGRYVLDHGEHTEGWLELNEGVPEAYVSAAYAPEDDRELLFRVSFALTPVERTSELDRTLHVD